MGKLSWFIPDVELKLGRILERMRVTEKATDTWIETNKNFKGKRCSETEEWQQKCSRNLRKNNVKKNLRNNVKRHTSAKEQPMMKRILVLPKLFRRRAGKWNFTRWRWDCRRQESGKTDSSQPWRDVQIVKRFNIREGEIEGTKKERDRQTERRIKDKKGARRENNVRNRDSPVGKEKNILKKKKHTTKTSWFDS